MVEFSEEQVRHVAHVVVTTAKENGDDWCLEQMSAFVGDATGIDQDRARGYLLNEVEPVKYRFAVEFTLPYGTRPTTSTIEGERRDLKLLIARIMELSEERITEGDGWNYPIELAD